MSDYSILPVNEDIPQQDLLEGHLRSMPQDFDVLELVSTLFNRFKVKGIEHKFCIHHFFNSKQDPHGVLIAFNEKVVIFWRSSCGHFWFNRKDISFEHPAGFLKGSKAPIIDKPQIGICYRFSDGYFRTLARRFEPYDMKAEYQKLIRVNPSTSMTDNMDEVDEGSSEVAHCPQDGFTLLKVDV